MTHPNDKQPKRPSSIDNMSFGDFARYLQSGFDRPVQEVIANHFQYANDAQERLSAIRALQAVGKDMLVTNATNDALDAGPEHPDELDEMTLAAYLDGALDAEDTEAVAKQLSQSLPAYLHYADANRDLTSDPGPRFVTPAAALDLVRVPEPVSALDKVKQMVFQWRTGLAGLLTGPQQMRWALAVATVAAALVIVPAIWQSGSGTSLPLTPSAEQRDAMQAQDMLLFGGPALEGNIPEGLTYPLTYSGSSQLTWEPVEGDVTSYTLTLYDATDADSPVAVETQTATNTEYTLQHDVLQPGVRYQVYVEANLANGGFIGVGTDPVYLIRAEPSNP